MPYTTAQLIGRWEDQRELKNLMGKYANCVLLNRTGELFDRFWAKTRDDVCLGQNDGWYAGAQAVRDHYEAVRRRDAQVASLLRDRFPQQLGQRSDEEIFGIGPFRVKPLSCPVIEIAEDGETAKGLWYCQGAYAEVYTWGPSASWTWGYCAADFIREEGAWKIWHLQWVNDIDARCGTSWSRPSPPMPQLPEFAPLRGSSLPGPNVPVRLRAYYSPDRPLTGAPRLPEPYATFQDTFTYGMEGGAQ